MISVSARSSSRLSRHWLAWPVALLLVLWGLCPRVMAERPPAPKLLPASTIALVSIVDVPEMTERFQNTSMGRMSQDPQLKPLIGALYGRVLEATSQLKDRIGLSVPELLAIPQGEVTLALVAPEEGPPAVVLLLDAGDRLSDAKKLLEVGTRMLDSSGARKSEQTVAGTKLVIYQGDGQNGPRNVAFFEKDATIVVGSDIAVLKQLLSVWNGGKGDTLADNPKFGAIMQRCRGAKGEPPHIVGYADPIGIIRAIGKENLQVQLGLAMMVPLGLDGLSAVGGSMIFDTEQFDSVMHGHLLLESPRSGVVKMIALESGDVDPQPWVPPDVAAYVTVHWNIEETYTTLANLYDSFNEEGAFSSAIQRRIVGPTGIDIGKDLVPSLDGRITMITWFKRPVSIQSQAVLLALGLKDSKPMEDAIQKVVNLSQGNLVKKSYAGKTYYQVEVPGLANLPPEQRPPLPCLGILDDSFLISNNSALLEKAITTLNDGSGSLADELDYKLIASRIRRTAGDIKPAMISIERPEESLRFIYDLINSEQTRTQLARQAENNPFFKSVQTALNENPLPPFAVLQRYLAPSGSVVVDDATGIHYTAFGLRRKMD